MTDYIKPFALALFLLGCVMFAYAFLGEPSMGGM